MIKVAILGGTGYTAVELIKILLRHPQVEIVAVTSRQEGTPLVAESHPSLTGLIDLRMEPFDPDKLVALGVQYVFGCLPHGVSMETLPAPCGAACASLTSARRLSSTRSQCFRSMVW